MSTVLWIVIGWLCSTVVTAVSSRLWLYGIMPDFAVITVVFLTMRRDPKVSAIAAVVLGYLVGRQALAPLGLHETGLALCVAGIYIVVGQLVSSGAGFFAFACGMAIMGYHASLFLLSYWVTGHARFSSWATALLLPNAIVTFIAAALVYPLMVWLDAYVTSSKREELSWR